MKGIGELSKKRGFSDDNLRCSILYLDKYENYWNISVDLACRP
jgi:hypothetical protein